MAGTIRTASRETWLELEDLVREMVSSLLAPLGVEHTLQYRRGVPPVVNEEVSTRILTHAIEAVGPDVLADTRQSGGGEDFSWYLEEVPGAMARLGVWSGRGPQLDLHQPTFDLDERALAVGVRVMANLVEQSAAYLISHFVLRESSLNAQASTRRYVPGPMLLAGRVRRSCTYSAGAPAISAASAITPR